MIDAEATTGTMVYPPQDGAVVCIIDSGKLYRSFKSTLSDNGDRVVNLSLRVTNLTRRRGRTGREGFRVSSMAAVKVMDAVNGTE